MKRLILSFLVFATLMLGGCDRVDVSVLQKQLDTAESTANGLRAIIADLRGEVERTGSEKAALILAEAEKALKVLDHQLPAMRADLAAIQKDADGKIPAWKAALAVGWPILVLGLKAIPGAGPIAAGIADIAWKVYATRRQKDEEAAIAITTRLPKVA